MSTSIYQKRFIEKRKLNKLCLKCGEPLDREGTYCVKCRKIITKQTTDRRKWYQENGICPRCGKNNLFGDEKVCLECNAKSYETSMKSREKLGKEHYNNVHKEWAKKEYKKRAESGICTRCGKRNADNGYKTCGICRSKSREYRRKKDYNIELRSDRYKKELCYFCDNPIKPRFKVCEKHYQINIMNLNNPKCLQEKENQKKYINRCFWKGMNYGKK